MQFTDALSEVLGRVRIVDLARRLNMVVGGREAGYTKALCPFHDDRSPSLALYDERGNPHYHCFACGAHGGAIDLVVAQRHVTRDEALRWLAEEVGVELPKGETGRHGHVAAAGRAAFTEWLTRNQQKSLLTRFAEDRDLDISVLRASGAMAVDMTKLVVDALTPGEQEALEAAGVLGRRRDKLVSLARGRQIVFPLDGGRGFIFRALELPTGAAKAQRYRFSKGLRKSDVLFGSSLAAEQIAAGRAPHGLFVVEGIMDVLRLRSLGLPAVGVLGTTVSKSQAGQLQSICSDGTEHQLVPTHLFLDSDGPGRRAIPGAIRSLLGAETPVPLDVVWPDIDGDPDELLKGMEPEDAVRQLGDWTYSVLAALTHAYAKLPIASALTDLATARPLTRVETLRYIHSQFIGRWPRVRDLADPAAVYLEGGHNQDPGWLRDALDRAAGLVPSDLNRPAEHHQPVEPLPSEPESRLRQALRLAQSSNFRREYPFDWGGMTRLALAANASLRVAKSLLSQSGRKAIPYAARIVPKDDGRVRLKAGPWPEDALIQQYVLCELLRARPDAPGWYLEVPAVRLIRSSNAGPIVTGPPSLRPVGPESEPSPVVAFAYQIDQEVLEGETPPRREGMFVPYRECWQQFIDHLDQFVARQPLETDTFFAVRLDISGFFDNLPRYAVEDILKVALGDAAERHFSGRDFEAEVAELLPSPGHEGEAGHRPRGEFLAKWLADQSFGFRYFDPADGQIKRSPNQAIGVPQGPDLSAYLANISLFPLDHEVTRLIEQERRNRASEADQEPHAAAVYGRYVDDMVIVTTSEKLLSQLETAISERLRELRLTMNSKHERTRAMTRRKIREWLLGERGAAVLVSASGEETPTTSRARVEDLLQVGPDTTRSQVLQLLHHLDLYARDWSEQPDGTSRVEATLRRLRQLPSLELRYYDWVSAARWGLHSLAIRNPADSGSALAARFVAWWRDIYGRDEAIEGFGENERDLEARQQRLDLAPVLMAFDALERSIDSRHDRRGGVEPDIRQALRESRNGLAQRILEGGLCEALIDSACERSEVRAALPRVDAMLRIQTFGIRGLAAGFYDTSDNSGAPDACDGASYAERRFYLNALGSRIGEYAAPVVSDVGQSPTTKMWPEAEPILGLHEAIARLLALKPQVGDPLAPIADVIRRWAEQLAIGQTSAPTPGLVASQRINSLTDHFLEVPSEVASEVDRAHAARSFVEIVAGTTEGHALMAQRPHLISAATGTGIALAVPPGVDAQAFFTAENGKLTAYALCREDQPPSAQQVVFGVESAAPQPLSEHLVKYDCVVPASHTLSSPAEEQRLSPEKVTAEDLKAFARAYRELVADQSAALSEEDGDGERRPISSLHLLRPIQEGASWRSFGATSRLPTGPQAFVRLGEGRLHSLAVHANGGHLWRVGFTVADHLGYRSFARSSELDRLTVGTLESDATADAIPFYVMQLTVPRLCGAFMGRSRLPIRSDHALPSGIARQLNRLETFGEYGDNPVVHLGFLLEGGAEAQAAELLRETPAPLQVAGALSAVFGSVGRAASRSEKIFAQTLPAPSRVRLTNRRTVDLWLAAASRLEQFPGEISVGLRTSAAAMRVLALSRLAQALTLEVWSLLDDEDIRRLEHYTVNVNELDLPEEVLLVGGSHSQRAPAAGDQVTRLFQALAQHAAPGATARAPLDQITPLGWIVALAAVTGLMELEPLPSAIANEFARPELLSARRGPRDRGTGFDRQEQELWKRLASVAEFLAAPAEEGRTEDVQDADWPWSAFSPLVTDAAKMADQLTDAARLIEGLYGLHARTQRGRLFQISDADERGYCLVSRDGARQSLAGWQIDRDSLGITRLGDLETSKGADGEPLHVWSETVLGERLVALSVSYRSLAEFAGAAIEDVPDVPPQAQGAAYSLTAETAKQPSTAEEDAPGGPGDVPEARPEGVERPASPSATVEQAPPATEDRSPRPASPPSSGSEGADDALTALKDHWHSRRGGSRLLGDQLQPVTMRIAFLQMNIEQVGHSFYHPICETEREKVRDWEGLLQELRGEGQAKFNNTKQSLCEAWRRAILREALERCDTLGVELLVLPEYSMRPDTVQWLAQEIEGLAPSTSVLAGTFRHPAGASPLEYHSGTRRATTLGAVVPLIVPGPALKRAARTARIHSRLKKYPSTGLSEFMRPEDRTLKAVYDMEEYDEYLPERLRYVRDLICSEVFVAMAPANVYSTLPALLELEKRFGRDLTATDAFNLVMTDLKEIARDTSPAVAHPLRRPRQTILAVPAATTRPFDHHIFGEAGAKAAGLTTVFANMSGDGRGQSCFIGHYRSNGIEGSNVWSLQSPYHGRAPGIWTYKYPGGCALGSDETALVVADVNPIDSSTSKPARQIENQPLSLVAHIPFFLGDKEGKVGDGARKIARRILDLQKAVSPSTAASCDLGKTELATAQAIAHDLAEVDATAKASLRHRGQGLQVSSMQPHILPSLPALIDWAFVPTPSEKVLIEVPVLEAADLDE